MDVDIACVGFGPATAGFLAALAPHILNEDGTPALESPSAPGLPLQVVCYERADDIGVRRFGRGDAGARHSRKAWLDPARDAHGGGGAGGEGGVPARPDRRQPPFGDAEDRRPGAAGVGAGAGFGVRAALRPAVPAKSAAAWCCRSGQFMQQRGRRADGLRHGADLAGNAGGGSADRRRQSRARHPPGRPGRGPRRASRKPAMPPAWTCTRP